MGAKLYKVNQSKRIDNAPDYVFVCPGCGHGHGLYISHPNDVGAQWTWDGNIEKPTVQPSIMSKWDYGTGKKVCHMFVREGKIIFLNDCTHELRGKTVDMKDIDTD